MKKVVLSNSVMYDMVLEKLADYPADKLLSEYDDFMEGYRDGATETGKQKLTESPR